MKKTKVRQLKTMARMLLEGKYAFLGLITFILLMAQSFLNSVIAYVFPAHSTATTSFLYIACSLLSNILYVVLMAGACRIYLNLICNIPIHKNDLFFAFTNQPEHVAVYAVVYFVLSFSFSETFNWFLDGLRGINKDFSIPVFIVVFLLISLLILWLYATFSMTLYLYCDAPWKRGSELLRESIHLIKGNRMRFLLLHLSFAGLGILSLATYGVGLLFIEPYVNMSLALFYKDLIHGSTEFSQEENHIS